MTDSSIPSFEAMLDVLERNPLKAIQLAGKAQRGVNRHSWEIAGIACGFARILSDDPKHREDFYDEEFFDNLKRLHPDKLLLHVFAYLYGSLDGAAYKRASEHARALKNVYDDRDIEVADIPQYLADHGGFDGLLKEQEGDQEDDQPDDQEVNSGEPSKHGGGASRVAQRPATQGPTITSGNDDLDDDDDGLDDEDLVSGADEDDESPVRTPRSVPASEGSEPKLKLLPREFLMNCLVARLRAPLTIEDVWQALRNGKKVNADFVMGEASPTYELYTGGGPFIDVLIEEFVG